MHKHFIEVLVYCWSILRTLPKTEKPASAPSQEDKDVSEEENIFSVFEVELEDEDDSRTKSCSQRNQCRVQR